MFSLYLSGSGESGELMLGGYDTSKIKGDIGCQQISRSLKEEGSGGGRNHFLHFTTRIYLGKKQQAADKKRRRPISTVVIDPEVIGLQAPSATVRTIVQKSGAKFMTVLPTINEEEEEQHISEEDEGYFIPCRHRSAVSHLSFFLGEKLWSITGDDLFIPSPVNPSWCRMMAVVGTTGEEPLVVLGDIFFKKFVTVFDFEGPGDKSKICIGAVKHRRGKRDRMKKKALLLSDGGGSSSNNTTNVTLLL